MNIRQSTCLLLLAAALASGCRSGVNACGRSLGWSFLPVYKQPAGFSSSYQQHLSQPPVTVEHVGGTMNRDIILAPAATPPGDDKVIFPEDCCPECQRPLHEETNRRS